ncbi:MAG: mechanosensitive ion channel protein MscS, partial [Gammaproteobacteria bacterium]|nr:mechanosensitive ion channel protein MscS [Gammaproteobacteria bacterium]
EGRIHLSSGKEFLRIKFRIWPNRGQPIETTYCQELTAALKSADPDYQTWMISIHYEVEAKKVQPQQTWSWRRLSTP